MKTKALLPFMLALTAIVLLGCPTPITPPTDTMVNLSAIPGVTAPVAGATPVTAITETDQYTGTVTWSGSPTSFAASTVYTATITLTAKTGYTLTGVAANFFTVAGATSVTNSASTGTVTAVFPSTAAEPDTVISIAAIAGVTAPATGATPVTAITETDQYTGTVTWSGSPTSFAASTVYTATITLTAKTGYTLTGVAANFFTVAGATSVTNSASTGTVTAVFPATATDPDLLSATSYFKTTPGFGIRYHVTDDYSNLDIYAWAVSQNFVTNLPTDLDFVYTLNRENSGYLRSSLGGKLEKVYDGKKYLMFYAGYPSSNQGHFYMNLMIPVKFKTGMTWTIDTKTYTVASPESITLGSDTLNNCQRINITDKSSTAYFNGSGYFLLAEGIGIVKLVFTRSDGTEAIFTYNTHSQLIIHTIAGTVYSSNDVPATGRYVQISNGNWGIQSITDSNGKFSLQVFGPDIQLHIGEDSDNDNVLDYTSSKDFWVDGITEDQTDLSIDLSTL